MVAICTGLVLLLLLMIVWIIYTCVRVRHRKGMDTVIANVATWVGECPPDTSSAEGVRTRFLGEGRCPGENGCPGADGDPGLGTTITTLTDNCDVEGRLVEEESSIT